MRKLTLILACTLLLVPARGFAEAGRDSVPAQPSRPLLDSVPAAVATASASRSWNDPSGWTNTKKGALIGLAAGAITGGLIGSMLCEGGCERPVLLLGAMGGAIGAGLGAGIGALIDGGYQNGPFRGPFGPTASRPNRARRVSITWRF